MRSNHSALQFFGLMATASVLALGAYTDVAVAETTASSTVSNGASASGVPVGASSGPEKGVRGLVDGTGTTVDSNRASRSPSSIGTPAPTTASGAVLTPTGRSAASRRTTPLQKLVRVTTPAAPAEPGLPTPAVESAHAGIGGASPVGSDDSAGAPTSATAPPATTTMTVPTHPLLADPTTRHRVVTPLSARQAPATQPAPAESATNPQSTSATTPPAAAAQPPGSRPAASQLVATPSPATNPVATEPVATEPVATQSVRARSAPASQGNRTRRLHQFQVLVTRLLRGGRNRAERAITATDAPLSPSPSHPALGLARGSLGPVTGSPPAAAGDAGLETRSARVPVGPPRPAESPRPRYVARRGVGMPPPIPHVTSSPPPFQTRLPVGGTAAAAGGGIASAAPSVLAEFEALALALATLLFARFSVDHATWRLRLSASRLEHPG